MSGDKRALLNHTRDATWECVPWYRVAARSSLCSRRDELGVGLSPTANITR